MEFLRRFTLLLFVVTGALFGVIISDSSAGADDPDFPGHAGSSGGPFSTEELQALEQFRPLVWNQLTQDFMKSDSYLITWLRAKNLNVNQAADMLFKALEWRQANQFDSDVREDFSGWDKKFLYSLDGTDKYGHPILIASLGRWNPRQLILSGQGDKFSRFIIRTLFELPATKARELQAAAAAATQQQGGGTGQFVSVFDMHGFNLRQHICLSCLPVYQAIVRAHQDFYPYASNRTVIINAPRAFETLMQSLRPLLSSRLRSLQVFGFDKSEWQRFLLETIEPNQLPVHYGGTKQKRLK